MTKQTEREQDTFQNIANAWDAYDSCEVAALFDVEEEATSFCSRLDDANAVAIAVAWDDENDVQAWLVVRPDVELHTSEHDAVCDFLDMDEEEAYLQYCYSDTQDVEEQLVEEQSIEACPSCDCKPGEVKATCNDSLGCGLAKVQACEHDTTCENWRLQVRDLLAALDDKTAHAEDRESWRHELQIARRELREAEARSIESLCTC